MKEIINIYKAKAKTIGVSMLQNVADTIIYVLENSRSEWEFNYFMRFGLKFNMFCFYVLDVELE